MTEEEATAEARRRWGDNGSIWRWEGVRGLFLRVVGIDGPDLAPHVGGRTPLGYGDTWEEAFAKADADAHKHKELTPPIRPR